MLLNQQINALCRKFFQTKKSAEAEKKFF